MRYLLANRKMRIRMHCLARKRFNVRPVLKIWVNLKESWVSLDLGQYSHANSFNLKKQVDMGT